MRCLLVILLMLGSGGGAWSARGELLLHAHNDYEHDRPLLEAFPSDLALLDGRLEDLDRGVAADLYPWISIDWSVPFLGDG